MGSYVFMLESAAYSGRTLHVLYRTAVAYRADGNWYPYFGQIVEGLRGDVNCDGEVNIADINAEIDIIMGDNDFTIVADVNGDGEYNIADVNEILDIILGGGGHAPDGHQYVDLGLPSGTLWATCNIGASKPEDYGDYFAWGETEPKNTYTWGTYKWCNGSYNTLTKYCVNSSYGTVDNRTVLDPEDDAASVNWGPLWCIPSKEQQDELREKCSWKWTTQNGVKGQLVTGPNGNTMFLPASGYYIGSSLGRVGMYVFYWSRTLYSTYSNFANVLYFDSGNVNWDYGYRYYGHTVRAVRVP